MMDYKESRYFRQPVGMAVLALNSLTGNGRLNDLNHAARVLPDDVRRLAHMLDSCEPSPGMHDVIDTLMCAVMRIETGAIYPIKETSKSKVL